MRCFLSLFSSCPQLCFCDPQHMIRFRRAHDLNEWLTVVGHVAGIISAAARSGYYAILCRKRRRVNDAQTASGAKYAFSFSEGARNAKF
ncbi:hypothetical protein B0H12DRAFT_1088529 [Mycena haematopus]|nr:hypothetical protein B0H12DRAFT_1088529 [Mycena haematopus]